MMLYGVQLALEVSLYFIYKIKAIHTSNGIPRTQDQYLLGQIEAKAVDADIEVSSVAFIRIKEKELFCFEDGITLAKSAVIFPALYGD